MTPAEVLLRERIEVGGPVPWSTVLELALYDDAAGFYATGGRAGRRGDFITSPEVGSLFGAVVARALDAWWVAAGRPDRWTVVEAGAGPGMLARTVLAAGPACLPALRYVMVERSAAQRASHDDLLARHRGVLSTRADLPTPTGEPVVVLANELLDNLPVDLLERQADGWVEVLVGVHGGSLVEVAGPLRHAVPPGAAAASVGARVPVQAAAQHWLREALSLAAGGRVVVFDYGRPTATLAARPISDWLRTYRGQQRGSPPLEALGLQDVTCDVAVDQLAAVAEPSSDRTQAEWLVAHGIDELEAHGRRQWEESGKLGDLASMKGRSWVAERRELCDPAGLGSFRVLEWDHSRR